MTDNYKMGNIEFAGNNINIRYKDAIYRFRMMDCKPENYFLLPIDGFDNLKPALQCKNDKDVLHHPISIHSEHEYVEFGRWDANIGEYVHDSKYLICRECIFTKQKEE